MKISRTVSYALQAVVRLGETFGQDPVPCSRLASEGGMPDRFLLQILRTLVAHEILCSTRGVDGGYTLGRTPQNITLLEIVEALDGPVSWTLPMAEAFPGETRARLQDVLSRLHATVRAQLMAVTVADLLAGGENSPAAESETAESLGSES
jgi:Rrf2 family protein